LGFTILQVRKTKRSGSFSEMALLRSLRDHPAFCVMVHNEKTLNLGQTWLPSFSAKCRYTTFGMVSSEGPVQKYQTV
jgi:hypothetical protein